MLGPHPLRTSSARAPPRYRERRLFEVFKKCGWEGKAYVPAPDVLKVLHHMGKADRELKPDVREATEFKEEFLVKLFGEAFWGKSNAEFDLIVDSVLKAN